MKKIFYDIVLLFVFIHFTSYAQSIIPDKFKETDIPKKNSEEIKKLNYSQTEFFVKFENDKLIIQEHKYKKETELKINNGVLKGESLGEWGGKLIFQSNNKKKKEIEIKKGNIKFIFKYNNKIYFIEGIAHLSTDKGSMYELSCQNNKFSYKKVLDFEDCPEAILVFDNKIYIASTQSFYKIEDLKIEPIFIDEFWEDLYPNSIAMKNEESVFLGIRGGIVELNLKTKMKKFYTENE